MLFKNAFELNPTLHYVYEHLQFTSSLGRNYLLNLPFNGDANQLTHEFDILEHTIALVKQEEHRAKFMHIRNNLHQINDIRPTITALRGDTILDDIQLFEIKKTAILTRRIAQDFQAIGCQHFPLANMDSVVTLLDPEHTNIPHFYIYSTYHPELAKWRERIQAAQSVQEAEEFRYQAQKVEDNVRTHLTEQLRPYCDDLENNLNTLSHFDLVLAKAKMAIDWNACRPKIADHTDIHQLFNPEVSEILQEKGRQFQPIDIHFEQETILLTGANMAGKSVLLKTVSLAQYLCQFGFYIPATEATMSLVDEIISSIGDKQSETNGLSSFAVEILTIDRIIKTGRSGKKVLALVDELARTTNPEEGKRLVSNFIRITTELGITTLITTHYSGIEAHCRRLRVKGLQLKENQVFTPGNISEYMDYSLVETTDSEVPMEAFAIAKLFGVDEALLTNVEP